MLPFANYNISSSSMRDQNINNNSSSISKRRKKRRPVTVIGGGVGDDMAVVKAAAWAWYQRNEGKPMVREFDITRSASRITSRPSRYKLEATKKMILLENRVLAENRVSRSSIGYDDDDDDDKTLFSHLLDTFEIESISKRIDDSLSHPFPVSPTFSMFRHDDHDHHYLDDDSDHYHDNDDDGGGFVERKSLYDDHCWNGKVNGFVKKVSKRNLWGRLMLMVAPATICGGSDDVASRPSRRTGKVAAAAVALVRSAARDK